MKRLTLTVLLLCMASMSYAAQTADFLTAQESKYLAEKRAISVAVIGTVTRLPFWGGTPEAPKGYIHDIVKVFENKLGVQFTYINYGSIDEAFTAIEAGEVDIGIGFVKSAKRAKSMAFTQPVFKYYYAGWIANTELEPKDFSHLHWACVEKSTACKILDGLNYTDITVVDQPKEFYQLLESGKVDALLDVYPSLRFYLGSNAFYFGQVAVDRRFGSFDASIALSKKNALLKDILDKTLLVADPELNSLSERYNIKPFEYMSGNNDTDSEAKVIRFTVDENAFPIYFWNENAKKYDGYVNDLLSLISSRTSLVFEYVEPNGRNIEDMLREGVVDILPASNSSLSRDRGFLRTVPYTTLEFSYLESKKWDNDGKVVGILDRINIATTNGMIKYTEIDSILKDIRSGKISNAYINVDLLDSLLISGEDEGFNIIPKPTLPQVDVQLSMAVNATNQDLRDTMDSVLNGLTKREIENLWLPYHKMEYNWGIEKSKVFTTALLTLLFVIIAALFTYSLMVKMRARMTASDRRVEYTEFKNQWLTDLIDAIPSMICILDSKGDVLLSNSTFKSMLSTVHSETDKDFIEILFDSFGRSFKSNFSETHYVELGASSVGYFHIINTPIHNSQDNSMNYLVAINDVTDMKKNEADLIELNNIATKSIESQKQFLAVVSHELRTPISAMMGLMEILSNNLVKEENKTLLSNAESSAKRLKILVGDILDYSKLGAKQLNIQEEYCNLADELSPMLRGFEASAQVKDIGFVLNWTPTKLLNAKLDVFRVNQIVSNILSNAIKFTEKGFISVDIDITHTFLSISVRDTGIGMTKQQVDRMFDPFTQAEDNIARRFGGTGLGMSIVSQLVGLMDGDIEVSSQLSLGTIVTITIPISAEPLEINYNQIDAELKIDDPVVAQWLNEFGVKSTLIKNKRIVGGNVYPDFVLQRSQLSKTYLDDDVSSTYEKLSGHILVIEDDPINRFLLEKQLAEFGIRSTLSENGVSALEMLRDSDPFDVIITDCHMPELNGFELSQIIRTEFPEYDAVPIIACTADNSIGIEDRARASGINELIYKPYDLSDLHFVLSDHLSLADNPVQTDVEKESWIGGFPSSQRAEMAEVVHESFSNSLEELCLEDADVKLVAHRVKGSAGVLQLEKLADIACELEMKPGDVTLKGLLIEHLEMAIRDAHEFLKGN
ncbi:ATP-binding protein [Vibrio campbellii]|uniref:ATP-binding protein n=1 Tax=Vibrio campbellii TaxID=680 RepID=UPI0009BF5B1B|nr:transporter substrate-binding domain-containing protein [Vibrio campbellii]OQQ04007.1 hypothetical protein BK412_10275 [Vibrio campbellii]